MPSLCVCSRWGTQPLTSFWYVTDTKGKPIGQGENGPLGYVGVEYAVFNGVPTNASGMLTSAEDFVFVPSAQELEAAGEWRMQAEDIYGDLPDICKQPVQCQNGR